MANWKQLLRLLTKRGLEYRAMSHIYYFIVVDSKRRSGISAESWDDYWSSTRAKATITRSGLSSRYRFRLIRGVVATDSLWAGVRLLQSRPLSTRAKFKIEPSQIKRHRYKHSNWLILQLKQCKTKPIIIRPLEYPYPGWGSNKFNSDPWREQDTTRVLIRPFEPDLWGRAIDYCIAFNPILFNLELQFVDRYRKRKNLARVVYCTVHDWSVGRMATLWIVLCGVSHLVSSVVEASVESQCS